MDQLAILTDLPSELIRDIGLYLDYGDVQSFRLACQKVATAVEALALSRLRLDWYLDNESYTFVFPLDKVQSYLSPGTTRAYHYVRHLSIQRVCPALHARSCPFDDLLQITPPSLEECWNNSIPRASVHKRNTFFTELMKVFLSSGLMKNLITIKWEVNCTLPDHGTATPCEEFLKLFATIICQRQTIFQSIEITCGLFGILPSGRVNKPLAWPCRELRILNARHTDGTRLRSSVPWIEDAIAHSPLVKTIDTDLTFDGEVMSTLFKPHIDYSSGARPVQFRTLNLAYGGTQLKPHIFDYLRNLRKLNLWWQNPSFDQVHGHKSYKFYHHQISRLWRQFASERIYIEEIKLNLPDVEHSLLDYLTLYPRGTLKSLTLCPSYANRRNEYETQDLPMRFFTGTLPAISSGLEELSIKADRDNLDWCFGALPESRTAFRHCRVLKSVFMTAYPELDPMETSDLLHEAFGGLPLLNQVMIHDCATGGTSWTTLP